jgi:hypothetical protein
VRAAHEYGWVDEIEEKNALEREVTVKGTNAKGFHLNFTV